MLLYEWSDCAAAKRPHRDTNTAHSSFRSRSALAQHNGATMQRIGTWDSYIQYAAVYTCFLYVWLAIFERETHARILLYGLVYMSLCMRINCIVCCGENCIVTAAATSASAAEFCVCRMWTRAYAQLWWNIQIDINHGGSCACINHHKHRVKGTNNYDEDAKEVANASQRRTNFGAHTVVLGRAYSRMRVVEIYNNVCNIDRRMF